MLDFPLPQDERERYAQREAIAVAAAETMSAFPDVDPADIWRCVHAAHVWRKSGVDIPAETVEAVISAENSWKKSSGHAFEEMVEDLANKALKGTGIRLYLQRETSELLALGALANETPDLEWLAARHTSGAFDLYAVVSTEDGDKVFGCVQSKTSIRDRVTRDREPSTQAMGAFFWSIAIVLDGDFLRLPKFNAMVNGGTSDYPTNGWHGVYVLSQVESSGRIIHVEPGLQTLRNHAMCAAEQWIRRRQWLNANWEAATADT